jgi:hypothetical protein
MNLGELKTELNDLMARTDYTAAKQVTHINRALRRLQTATNLPDMEKAVVLSLDSALAVDIPSDHRHTRHIFITEDLVPCEKIDINRARHYQGLTVPPEPRVYYRLMDKLYFPGSEEGDELNWIYYAAWDALASDVDYNELTVLSPEAVIYGAAVFACTYFIDSRGPEMEKKFLEEVELLKLQKWNEEIATGSGQTMEPMMGHEGYEGGW